MAAILKEAPGRIRDAFSFRGGIGHQQQGMYDYQDVIQNLQVEYRKKYYSSKAYVDRLKYKIEKTNKIMQEERVMLPNEDIYYFLDIRDYVFKYKVSMYNRHWSIHKSFSQFRELQKDIFSLKDRYMNSGGNYVQLPEVPEELIRNNTFGDPLHNLGQDLLNMIFGILASPLEHQKFAKVLNFFGISIPFVSDRYNRIMEMACEKLSMGRPNDGFFEKKVKSVFRRWQDRWLVVGKHNVFYYEKPEDPDSSMRDNISFDTDTDFLIEHVGQNHVVGLFKISRRDLRIRFDGTMNGLISMEYIIKAIRHSNYTRPHRFTSFAPIRDGNDCVLFADGIGYYHEVYKNFENAESDIMITDWWFSPEFPLIRPIKNTLAKEKSRVDMTLQRAAARGVHVYILVFKEFAVSLNNDSEHAKVHMESLHPNIKVLRHPNVVLSLWSHHEKMIIIDRKKVFMGGLDLCWGRMDGNNHPLFNDQAAHNFPGVDYYNPLKKDIAQGRLYEKSLIESTYPRLPWHDVTVMLVGRIVNDFVMHFTTYWNHAKETNNEIEVLVGKKQPPRGGFRDRLRNRQVEQFLQQHHEHQHQYRATNKLRGNVMAATNGAPRSGKGQHYKSDEGEASINSTTGDDDADEATYNGGYADGMFNNENQQNVFTMLGGPGDPNQKAMLQDTQRRAIREELDRQMKETNHNQWVPSGNAAKFDAHYDAPSNNPKAIAYGAPQYNQDGFATRGQVVPSRFRNPFIALGDMFGRNFNDHDPNIPPLDENMQFMELGSMFQTNNAEDQGKEWSDWLKNNEHRYFGSNAMLRQSGRQSGLGQPGLSQGPSGPGINFNEHYLQNIKDNSKESRLLFNPSKTRHIVNPTHRSPKSSYL